MNTPNEQLRFPIIDTRMTVRAMRDSGYKSTTHALAEVIDNSVEAGATAIEIFGLSDRDERTNRFALSELAVLDNGEGMDSTTLRGCLCYGSGTRSERRGIGRFGVGLPNASMSQARFVDVWSWQSGVTNALHASLYIDDVDDGAQEILEPELMPIPDTYLQSSLNGFEDAGTLVVWSDLDRVEWRRASTTFAHIEYLLGRIYRRFLAAPSNRLHGEDARTEDIGEQRSITCIPLTRVGKSISTEDESIIRVRPNDPLYLMTGTSCPEDFGDGPMFIELEASPFKIPMHLPSGAVFQVRVRASYAKPHVRNSSHPDARWPEHLSGRDAGRAPWGTHAGQNMGVSIVRAHRELDIDTSLINQDTTERWWKVEIDFPPDLDDLFGVTNNKQGATTLQRISQFDWSREALPGENSRGDVRRRMEADGDKRLGLLDLREQLDRIISLLRNRAGQSNQPRKNRHQLDEDQKADEKTTEAIKRRLEGGHKGQSDLAGEQGTQEEHVEEQINTLVEKHHFDRNDAMHKVGQLTEYGSRVSWILSAQPGSPAFFDVEPLPNLLQVAFNTNPSCAYILV